MNPREYHWNKLGQEGNEIAHRVSKVLEFGASEKQPEQYQTNAQRVTDEVCDLMGEYDTLAQMGLVEGLWDGKGVLTPHTISRMLAKQRKVARFYAYSKDKCGTVQEELEGKEPGKIHVDEVNMKLDEQILLEEIRHTAAEGLGNKVAVETMDAANLLGTIRATVEALREEHRFRGERIKELESSNAVVSAEHWEELRKSLDVPSGRSVLQHARKVMADSTKNHHLAQGQMRHGTERDAQIGRALVIMGTKLGEETLEQCAVRVMAKIEKADRFTARIADQLKKLWVVSVGKEYAATHPAPEDFIQIINQAISWIELINPQLERIDAQHTAQKQRADFWEGEANALKVRAGL